MSAKIALVNLTSILEENGHKCTTYFDKKTPSIAIIYKHKRGDIFYDGIDTKYVMWLSTSNGFPAGAITFNTYDEIYPSKEE